MSPVPSSRPNMNRPGNASQHGVGLDRVSSSPTHGRTSASPPTRPDSGEGDDVRTRSWAGEGQQAGGGDRVGDGVGVARTPRSCRLPAPSVPACRCRTRPRCAPAPRVGRPLIIPPGSRSRASRKPSAARAPAVPRTGVVVAPSSRQRRPVQDGGARRRGHGQLPVVDAPPADVGERGADPSVQRGRRAHHPRHRDRPERQRPGPVSRRWPASCRRRGCSPAGRPRGRRRRTPR